MLDWDKVGIWIRDNYISSSRDIARRDRAKRRHDLYAGGGDEDMETFIRTVFKDPEVISRRREWVAKAKFNNVSRRLVNELSSVYSVPSMRTVAGDADNANYQELQRRCRQHEIARRWNRWENLHNAVAVGFRLRDTDPVIDVVTPENFFAVSHPLDPTKMVAIGLKLSFAGPAISGDAPEWVVWTDSELFYISKSGHIITSSVKEHRLGRMPWLLLSSEPPCGELVPDNACEDIAAAHRAVWFLHVLELKEAKSATKQPVLAGDMTRIARGQAADSEVPIEAPDGVVVSTVDFSMDLSMFRDAAARVYETVAANRGIAPDLLRHAPATSADSRELMRAPLKELRREQEVYLREFEREFAAIQAVVLKDAKHELSFSTDGWAIDFAETRTPLDPKSELERFEHERRLGLTDTIEEMIRRNPDLTVAAAFDELERHVTVEVARNTLMRPLVQISGSMGASAPAPASGDADQNGRKDSVDGSTVDEHSDAGLRAIGGAQ